jgi:prepilin-type N-terminal cleavage/methylation domain-containing protein
MTMVTAAAGFTLVELLAATTITVLLAGATVTLLRTSSAAARRVEAQSAVQQEPGPGHVDSRSARPTR